MSLPKTKVSTQPFTELPYALRQRLVVMEDEVAQEARGLLRQADRGKDRSNKDRLSDAIKKASNQGVVWLVQATNRMRQDSRDVLPLGFSEVSSLRFPPGHPLKRVLYIGNPVSHDRYYPAAQFHRFLVEHKFAELMDILVELGASHISVSHAKDTENTARLGSALQGVPMVGGRFKREKSATSSSQIVWGAELPGNRQPRLPQDVVWFPHEPTWRKVAEARLEYGMRSFHLLLRHRDALGVDNRLEAVASKAEFEMGGSFEQSESVEWEVAGEFLAPIVQSNRPVAT